MKEWITGLIQGMGAPGIGVLMFAENLFPPLPSEFIMPLAGYMASQDKMSLAWVIVAGSIGSVLGAVLWYWIGMKVGSKDLRRWVDAHGTWLGLCEKDLDRSDRFFHKHGRSAVFIGRLLPLVRTLISVPAGISRMRFTSFLLFSCVGTTIWTAALAVAGFFLGKQFPKIGEWMGPIGWAIIGIAVVGYIVRVYRIKRS